jgi:DNA-binding PadR family transcriptional regulator
VSDHTDIERQLPLKPIDFHVLLVLTEGARHGYGIVKQIEARSEGRIRLQPGNLYRYLRRLVDEGLVKPADRRPVVANAGEPQAGEAAEARRRYYEVTPLGRRVLGAEVDRMRALVAAAESGLGPVG